MWRISIPFQKGEGEQFPNLIGVHEFDHLLSRFTAMQYFCRRGWPRFKGRELKYPNFSNRNQVDGYELFRKKSSIKAVTGGIL